jgi:hypothetical protein
MVLVRNVQEAIPSRLPRSQVAALADRVRRELGIEPGAGVARAFERLGGTYDQVPGHFGTHADRIVVSAGGKALAYEHHLDPPESALGFAEAMGVLFLHHPLVMRAHGRDAVTAVRRITPEGDLQVVRDEALWFGLALAMPRADFCAAHAEDPDPAALGRRFHVRGDTAAKRARALGLEGPGFAAPSLREPEPAGLPARR